MSDGKNERGGRPGRGHRETDVLVFRLEDPYFRERAADLRDVGKRLLDILTKCQRSGIPNIPDGSVIVTSELLPSVTAQLDGQTIRGLIAEKGGQTAHATILARALGIPLLIHVPDATKIIRTDDRLIVDGLAGRVFINPAPAILREYDRLEADLQAHRTALKGLIELPAMTLDGVQIKPCANIGKSADAVAAATLNADGVGLYRTEFVFLVQDHSPSEEEQYQMYRTTAEHLKPREVVIRVLDIGSDKLLPVLSTSTRSQSVEAHGCCWRIPRSCAPNCVTFFASARPIPFPFFFPWSVAWKTCSRLKRLSRARKRVWQPTASRSILAFRSAR